MDIGLIGNGAIARVVTRHCENNSGRLKIAGALVLPEDGDSVGNHPTFVELDAFLNLELDLVVECASQNAVLSHGPEVLGAGIDLMVISVGAFADPALADGLANAVQASGARVIIPAGALAGLDAIAAASSDALDSVTLLTRKPPSAWAGAPGVADLDLAAVQDAMVIFSGSARAAAQAFPKNANVAAALALAGIGMDATQVTLVADPEATRNSHHVEAHGAFGRLTVEVEAEPSPDNPKTSHLAALSIIRMLDRLTDPMVI